MATLDQYIIALERFISSFPKKVDEIILNNEQYFISKIQDRLYDEGKDGNGQSLGTYSLFYENYKRDIGAVYDHVTLFNTGSFYGEMFMSVFNGVVDVFSKDEKTPAILEMFTGFDVFGFTEQEQEFLYEKIIKPDILELIITLPSTIKIEIV